MISPISFKSTYIVPKTNSAQSYEKFSKFCSTLENGLAMQVEDLNIEENDEQKILTVSDKTDFLIDSFLMHNNIEFVKNPKDLV